MKYWVCAFILLGACQSQNGSMLEEPILVNQGEVFSQSLGPSKKLKSSYLTHLSGNLSKELLLSAEKGDWKGCIQIAQRELKNKPYDEDLVAIMATAYAAQGEFVQSAFWAKLILNASPNNALALNILGLGEYAQAKRMEDYKKAMGHFEKAAKNSSTDVAPLLNLGFANLDLGANQHAVEYFNQAIARCDACNSALVGHSTAMNRLGKDDRVEKNLNKVLSSEPENAIALYQLALYYRRHKDEQEKSKVVLQKMLNLSTPLYGELQDKVRYLLITTE